MEHMIKHIEGEQPLAIVFNKVISKITTLWIMTRPRIFDDNKGEEAAYKIITYYQILLWEKWLHEVIKKKKKWITTIDEYFNVMTVIFAQLLLQIENYIRFLRWSRLTITVR